MHVTKNTYKVLETNESTVPKAGNKEKYEEYRAVGNHETWRQ